MSGPCVYCGKDAGLIEQQDDDDGGILELDVCDSCYYDDEEELNL